MEKLKLEHLAPYLPYGLKAKGFWGVRTINSLCKEKENYYWVEFDEKEKRKEQVWTIQPILRPLSDLTKEIPMKDGLGEWKPKEVLRDIIMKKGKYSSYDISWIDTITPSKLELLSFWLNNQLIEWHFDVFGLLDKGLAVNYNDVK